MLSLGIGLLIGLVLGLTGAGGSVLAVPLLMGGLGYSLPAASGTSLGAVASAAALGMALRWRQREIVWPLVALLTAGGVLLSPLGLWLAKALPQRAVLLSFVLLVGVMAWRLWQQASAHPDAARVVRAARQDSAVRQPLCAIEQGSWGWPCLQRMGLAGAATGLLSGLYGVGGGFIIVPVLVLWAGLSLAQAVGVSLAVIALIAGSTFGIFLWSSPLPHGFEPVLLGALLGMLLGSALARRMAGPRLQQALAALMVLLALQMLIQTVF